jgi:hypothetical protein
MKQQLLQITGTPNLYRDLGSMAIINKDQQGLQEYQARRNAMAAQKQEINNIKSDINEVKDDLQEIKQLMLQLLGKEGSNG